MNIELLSSPYPYVATCGVRSIEKPEGLPWLLFRKIKVVPLASLKCIQCLFSALRESADGVSTYAHYSFRVNVIPRKLAFNFFGGVPLVIHRLAVWILDLAFRFARSSTSSFVEKMRAGEPFDKASLASFAGQEINCNHFIIDEIAFDTSEVSANITLDNLQQMFAEINFDRRDEPGYIPENSRRGDYAHPYSPEALARGLARFIRRVKKNKPFLGTPRAEETAKLKVFYKQIEDAILLSIAKVEKDLADFRDKFPQDPRDYDESQMRAYDQLLAARARPALDLAIVGAGNHCGARYMSEAMAVHRCAYGEDKAMSGDSLEANLNKLLASKRYDIALGKLAEEDEQRRIQALRDNRNTAFAANPHAFGNYMGTLGQLLGLPGTQHISEHFADGFDRETHLTNFFETYTVETIIETVNHAVKTSQSFREQILDWIAEQSKGWQEEHYRELEAEKIAEIRTLLDTNASSPSAPSPAEKLHALIDTLKKNGVPLPIEELQKPEDGWKEFLSTLLAEEPAKLWIANQYQMQHNVDPNRAQLIQMKGALQVQWVSDLDEETIKLFKDWLQHEQSDPLPELVKKAQDEEKLSPMRQILPSIKPEVLKRILLGDPHTSIENVVQGWIVRERGVAFLQALNMEIIKEQGLPKPLMEWLLVSHQILNPQFPLSQLPLTSPAFDSAQSISNLFTLFKEMDLNSDLNSKLARWQKHLLDPHVDWTALERGAREILEMGYLPREIDGARFRPSAEGESERLLRSLFDACCWRSEDKVIAATQELYPSSKWKQILFIDLSKRIARIATSPTFAGSICGVVVLAYLVAVGHIHRITNAALTSLLSLLLDYSPSMLAKMSTLFFRSIYYFEYRCIAFLFAMLITDITLLAPEIRFTAAIRKLKLRKIVTKSLVDLFQLAKSHLMNTAKLVQKIVSLQERIRQRFLAKTDSTTHKTAKLRKAREIWDQSIQHFLALHRQSAFPIHIS